MKTHLVASLIFAGTCWLIPSSTVSQNEPQLKQGIAYVKLRLYPQAIEAFKSILAQQPTQADALFQLGNVYILHNQLELAIQTFDKILTFDKTETQPNLSPTGKGLAHLALAETYCKIGELETAAQHTKAAIHYHPTHPDSYYRLGYIYTHQALFDAAITQFKQALALKPDFPEAYEWLGLIALMQDKPQQAVQYYQNAIRKNPYVQSTYYNLAKAYRLLGDMNAAAQQLKQFELMKTYYDKSYAIELALDRQPMNTALRIKLAEIHLAYKNTDAAIHTYQTLQQLNPEFVEGYDKLARLYMNLNKPQQAIPLFQKVLELNPYALEAHVRLGWLYAFLGKFEKAENHLKTAIDKRPQLTLAYHGLAEIYLAQQKNEKAIKVYRQIIQINPEDKDASKALQQLQNKNP